MVRLKKKSIKLIIFLSIFAIITIFLYVLGARKMTDIDCRLRLKTLGTNISSYDFNQNLEPEIWYDLLMHDQNLPENYFRCKISHEKGKSGHYYININYYSEGEPPPKMVVVFEGDSGWNLCGDVDDIRPIHHGGCHVLFSDGTVEFVHEDDFTKLNWTKIQMKLQDDH
ncbi:MAG: DUF1559 domain-containing protein [Phycisphaerae bacterium]|nr:DUF1559 domain-containing protein [Phycisphaerae bacterium]